MLTAGQRSAKRAAHEYEMRRRSEVMQDEYLAKLERDHQRMRAALELVWNVVTPTDEAVAVERLREHVRETLMNLEVKDPAQGGGTR